ncbi:MAG: hypothetical protein HY238_03520 [Acidobacteria bacterium]|nr:hypothetical protein [Acidobacteriota bacterium]
MPGKTRTAPRKKRALAAPLLSFSLEAEMKQLKKEPEWRSGDRNSVTLIKTRDYSTVLVALRKGAAMCGHELRGPVTLLVLNGAIRFGTDKEQRVVKDGGLLAIEKGASTLWSRAARRWPCWKAGATPKR